MIPGITTAQLAILVDKFHLTPEQIGKLTDRQIHEVYFHRRTKDGAIDVPGMAEEAPVDDEAPTLESATRDLEMLKAILRPEDYAKAKADLKEKYGGKVS